ncbi:MAG: aspartyl-tRNA(Asn)/glutamyl-tRNA(Gln) amidotransferase subunit C [Planctomycetota bacterium]|jgi:aspartyl-tRNA(Asn)/glutamyl-tRNA(Gln) amidotransferase subunit C
MSDPKLELLKKTAELARLQLSDAEAQSLAPQFDAILEHFEVLSQVDVEGVEPTFGAFGLLDVKRPDVPHESGPFDALLDNSPDRHDEHFGVPKVIGGAE